MSTGVNLGFASPITVVDIDNPDWFSELLGVPGIPDAIDATKLAEARSLVLDGIKSAAASGASTGRVVVLAPDADLASAAKAIGCVAAPHARVSAVVGDHAANAAGGIALAQQCDALHSIEAKFVCVLNLTTSDGTLASDDDTTRTIAGLQAGGVEADAWVVPTPRDDQAMRAIESQATGGGRANVVVAALGAGARAQDAYGDALVAWASGSIDRAAAADQIAAALALA